MSHSRPGAQGGAASLPPIVSATWIQLLSFLAVLAAAHCLSLFAGMQLTVVWAALLQGGIAAAASRWYGLPPWWLPIQVAFPVAVVAALALRLPSGVFLGLFALLAGLYWTTFRTRVPFYPSGPAVWSAVKDLLPAGGARRCGEIRSGVGGLVLGLSEARKESAFVGIEVAPLPWLASRVRGWVRRSNARFLRGDYHRFDFAPYDVVFAYLSPAAMAALWRKASEEMRPGTLLLSYEFDIPGMPPHISYTPAAGGPMLYGWYL
jgi:hypothetical protein